MRLLLALLLTGLAGCGSHRFHRAWERFDASPATGPVGRWEGEWRSEWNDHSGRLRCLMTADGPDRYLAWFHARYGLFFSFQYETVFTVTEEAPELVRFEGEQDLGKLAGGLYRYTGAVQGDAFDATYAAENGDHGVFELRRIE